ncbi:MAG: hypothetical protein KBA61_00220 [Spirochaetes bacterium]|nr:hypothetical protein [Spirochaetota bacterium]
MDDIMMVPPVITIGISPPEFRKKTIFAGCGGLRRGNNSACDFAAITIILLEQRRKT